MNRHVVYMLLVAATGNRAHAAPCATPDPRNITVPLYDPGIVDWAASQVTGTHVAGYTNPPLALGLQQFTDTPDQYIGCIDSYSNDAIRLEGQQGDLLRINCDPLGNPTADKLYVLGAAVNAFEEMAFLSSRTFGRVAVEFVDGFGIDGTIVPALDLRAGNEVLNWLFTSGTTRYVSWVTPPTRAYIRGAYGCSLAMISIPAVYQEKGIKSITIMSSGGTTTHPGIGRAFKFMGITIRESHDIQSVALRWALVTTGRNPQTHVPIWEQRLLYQYRTHNFSPPFDVELYVSADKVWDGPMGPDAHWNGTYRYSVNPSDNKEGDDDGDGKVDEDGDGHPDGVQDRDDDRDGMTDEDGWEADPVRTARIQLTGATDHFALYPAAPYLLAVANPQGMQEEADDQNNVAVLGFAPDNPTVTHIVPSPNVSARPSGAVIQQLVMHATYGGSSWGPVDWLSHLKGTSAHYVVFVDGRIVQMVPERDKASHAPPSNSYTIGVELCDGASNSNFHYDTQWWKTPLAAAERKSAARLVKAITDAHQDIKKKYHWIFPYEVSNTNSEIGDRPETTAFLRPICPMGPPKPFQFDLGVSCALYTEGTIPIGAKRFRDGFGVNAGGVIAHAQVLNRTEGRHDPWKWFRWDEFMSAVENAVVVQVHSPVELMVVDPLGRRAGIDPSTGEVVAEIPGAELSGWVEEGQFVAVPNAMAGDFGVQLSGVADGTFRVEFTAADGEGGVRWTQVAGATGPGIASAYMLRHDQADAANMRVYGDGNLTPVAVADAYSASLDAPTDMDVLHNDSDPDVALVPSSVEILQPPAHGTANVDAGTGHVVFVPTTQDAFTDSFTYRVQDDEGALSNEATVSVTFLRAGDSDYDGDVDAADWAALTECLSGPGGVTEPECSSVFDFDDDRDVDLSDVAAFLSALTPAP